jgi:hypothetical protein
MTGLIASLLSSRYSLSVGLSTGLRSGPVITRSEVGATGAAVGCLSPAALITQPRQPITSRVIAA